jgi:hypothetical protein
MIHQGENVVCPECKSFDLIKKGKRKTLTGASQRFKCLSCNWAGSGVIKSSGVGRVHAMIPDTQVTPDTPTDHLEWIGHYLAEIRPDVIVHIGDHADMESLSSYDFGKKASEGRRVINDLDAANKAMRILTKPITDAYSPELHITLGNHENRINIATECDAKLDGFLSINNLNYADLGWTVHDFLKPASIDGVTYCHYFYNPMSGRPFGGESIVTKMKNIGFTFSMGHQQCHQTGLRELNNGRIIRGLISGACYLHDEDYKGHQGNGYWRGIIIKHEVFEGCYDIMEVSLDFLCRKYEGMPVSLFMQKKYPDIYERSTWLKRLAARHLRDTAHGRQDYC